MINRKRIIGTCVALILALCSCVHPEREDTAGMGDVAETENLISGDELTGWNGKEYDTTIGSGELTLTVDAEVIVPSKVVTGTAEMAYVSVEELAAMLGVSDITQLENDCWGLGSPKDGVYPYNYNIYREEAFSYFFTSDSKNIDEEGQSLNPEELKELVQNAAKNLGYEAGSFSCTDYGYFLTFGYSPSVDGTPIVSENGGVGKTMISVNESGVTEMSLEKKLVNCDVSPASVLSPDAAVGILSEYYESAQIAPISSDNKILYIRLAYYVDENDRLMPVWCFGTEFADGEYVLYCLNAETGEIVFDYSLGN